jgi:simple sugar transport system permease protein
MTNTETLDHQQSAAAAASGEPGPRRPALAGLQRHAKLLALLRQSALLPVIGLLLIAGSAVSPAFFTVGNFTDVGQQVSALGVVVVAESLVLLTGGMDLSLQSTYGLAAMVGAWLILPKSLLGQGAELSPVLGMLVALLVGAAIGLINGVMIVKARLNGFIFTLAMLILLAGIQTGIVSGQTLYNLPGAFTYIGSAYWLGVPVSLYVTGAIFVAAGLFLRYHRTGRAIYAIGGNPEAARAAGVKVDRIRIAVYVVAGVLAAFGGLIEAGRLVAVTSSQGNNLIFTVFAAAVIGGISLRGGRGNMLGAASGVVLLGLVQNVLVLDQVQTYWIDAVDGGVIVLALVLSRLISGEGER